jgi:hypothetical protein
MWLCCPSLHLAQVSVGYRQTCAFATDGTVRKFGWSGGSCPSSWDTNPKSTVVRTSVRNQDSSCGQPCLHAYYAYLIALHSRGAYSQMPGYRTRSCSIIAGGFYCSTTEASDGRDLKDGRAMQFMHSPLSSLTQPLDSIALPLGSPTDLSSSQLHFVQVEQSLGLVGSPSTSEAVLISVSGLATPVERGRGLPRVFGGDTTSYGDKTKRAVAFALQSKWTPPSFIATAAIDGSNVCVVLALSSSQAFKVECQGIDTDSLSPSVHVHPARFHSSVARPGGQGPLRPIAVAGQDASACAIAVDEGTA